MTTLNEEALATLFFNARTHNAWLNKPVDDSLLRKIYETCRWAPTSANASPLRVVYVKSAAAKERLRPAMAAGNVEKTMAAPATAILAYDWAFHTKMGTLFPARPEMGTMFAGMPDEKRTPFLIQNASLQAAYFILTARALGLDCGPMGGFDNAKVDEAFLSSRGWRSSVLVNLGYGDATKLYPRNPRLSFDEAGVIE